MTDERTGRLELLLGRPAILDDLAEIRAGGKLDEKWTLVSVSPEVLPVDAAYGDLDLAVPGVRISHEFDSRNPYEESGQIAWIRFDFETEQGKTSGRLTFDRRPGEANGVNLEARFEGMADVYGQGESYFKLEILTGYPFAESN